MEESKIIYLSLSEIQNISLALHKIYHVVLVDYNEEKKLMTEDIRHQTVRFTPFASSRIISKTYLRDSINEKNNE